MIKLTNEMKVGILVFFGIILMIMAIFYIGDFRIEEGYDIKVLFNFTRGIEVDAPVRLSGVEVGKVKSIRLLEDKEKEVLQVELTMWIHSDIRLRRDAKVFISTFGLLGDKYIEISPGSYEAEYLDVSGEAMLVGVDPIQLEKIAVKGEKIINEIHTTVASINEIIADRDVKEAIKESIFNIRDSSRNFRQFSENLNDAVQKEKAKKIVDDIEVIAANFREFSEDIKNHPWKLLVKGKEKKPEKEKEAEGQKDKGISTRRDRYRR